MNVAQIVPPRYGEGDHAKHGGGAGTAFFFFVTPAKAGVQTEAGLDTGLRRYDEQNRGTE